MKHKICKKCLISKEENISNFHKSDKYFNSICKICRSSEKPIVSGLGSKICNKCLKEYPANLDNFHYTNRSKDGLRDQCKLCRCKDKKEYRSLNKEKINAQNREYYSRPDIAEKISDKRREEDYRKRKRDREKCLRKSNPKYKLIHNLRTSFNRYIKKESTTFDYLGIDREGFISHIESQFLDGMSWDNYGFVNGDRMAGWHVDHIKPLCSFNFDTQEEIYKAWHYTNLRPLWATDNLSKGGRLAKDD